MTDRDPHNTRPANDVRDSAVAALGGVAFIGLLVSVACAWGFADAGHPIWALLSLGVAAASAGGFRLASAAGSGKPRATPSDRVPLERLLPLRPGTDRETRTILRQQARSIALQTGGWFAAGAFGMLAWHYAAADRPAWSAAAAACSAIGAALLASGVARKRTISP